MLFLLLGLKGWEGKKGMADKYTYRLKSLQWCSTFVKYVKKEQRQQMWWQVTPSKTHADNQNKHAAQVFLYTKIKAGQHFT